MKKSLLNYLTLFKLFKLNYLLNVLSPLGIPDCLTCLLRNLYTGQEETELDMEQQTGSK